MPKPASITTWMPLEGDNEAVLEIVRPWRMGEDSEQSLGRAVAVAVVVAIVAGRCGRGEGSERMNEEALVVSEVLLEQIPRARLPTTTCHRGSTLKVMGNRDWWWWGWWLIAPPARIL